MLKNAFQKPSVENSTKLYEYLSGLGGRELTTICKRQNIFKTKWEPLEENLIDRCHIQSAADYLGFLLEEEWSEKIAEDIKALIAEAYSFIYKFDDDFNTSFKTAITNSLPSRIHYKHAEWLFYQNTLPEDANKRYIIDILVLYALRLPLEQRILSFLGIDFIESENGSPIGISKLFPIVKSLENIEFKSEIDFDQIKWVLDWLNHYMHRHLRPYPWVIHQAFQILNPLLLPTERTTPNGWEFSFYGSTTTKDWALLKDEIKEEVQSTFKGSTIHWKGEVEIKIEKNE